MEEAFDHEVERPAVGPRVAMTGLGRNHRSRGAKSAAQAQRIVELEAQITELKRQIESLEFEVARWETDTAEALDRGVNHSVLLPAYQTLLADLDDLFGIKHLPIALRLSLDAFAELL